MPATIDPRPEAITFDCYGTLIDWEAGILAALGPVAERHGVAIADRELLELYAGLEAEIEEGPYLRYREVLGRVVAGVGERLGFSPSANELDCLADSIGDWPPFPDTVAALSELAQDFRLGVISNVDDELFARTAQHLPVAFDPVVTAEQVGAYKPSHRNFEVALERLDLPRERLLHCAQSLYHDAAPARELGIACVWVDRRSGRAGGATAPSDARPDYEVADLDSLVALLNA